MFGGREGLSDTRWHLPGSVRGVPHTNYLSTKDLRLVDSSGVSAVTCSDPKSRAITGWVNGHIVFRTREVTDLLGSAARRTVGGRGGGDWVGWGRGGGSRP